MKRILDPKKIEKKSFEIIEGLLSDYSLTGSKLPFPLRAEGVPLAGRCSYEQKEVVQRVIHATTDLDYAKELSFHPHAIDAARAAIRKGMPVICDVAMVMAGINKKTLREFGGKVICLINDEDVMKEASRMGIARAIVAMRNAARFMDGAVVAIGNAPTALFTLCDMVKEGEASPAVVIGVPVGFVGAKESKKELLSAGVPYITNSGTKGGSSVAAACVNALLIIAKGGDR